MRCTRRSRSTSTRRLTSLALLVCIAAAGAFSAGQRASGASRSRALVAAGTNRVGKDVKIEPAGLDDQQIQMLVTRAANAGVQTVMASADFGALEAAAPAPAGEWRWLDALVRISASHGMRVRLQVRSLPNWARDAGRPSYSAAKWLPPRSPSELAAWRGFLTRLVGHFGTNVAYYEIWNEPDIHQFWYPQPSPSEYAVVLHDSDVAIKQVDAHAIVMFGGLSRNDLGFLQQTYAALDQRYGSSARTNGHFFDELCVHPYSAARAPSVYSTSYVYKGPFGPLDDNFTGFTRLHAFMAGKGEGAKRIYIGEYGFPTAALPNYPAVPDALRARYLTQAYSIAAQATYVDALSWYAFTPSAADPAPWTLLSATGQPSSTYRALVQVP